MTSVEIPYSIAAALPSLAVLDITNEVAHDVARSGYGDGIAYVSSGESALVRIAEREGGRTFGGFSRAVSASSRSGSSRRS